MARNKEMVDRLHFWAHWKVRQLAGGVGYSSSSAFIREATGGYRELHDPISYEHEVETNEAVESLRNGQQHLYAVLQAYYLTPGCAFSPAKVGVLLGKAPSTISANLEQGDAAIMLWLRLRHKNNCIT